jgi:hypothetical protein
MHRCLPFAPGICTRAWRGHVLVDDVLVLVEGSGVLVGRAVSRRGAVSGGDCAHSAKKSPGHGAGAVTTSRRAG